ncbi:hypothetical protein TNCV_1982071 [Trichonephila clavipes]|nr:hypothetical protein TNCV_1982071 [Trichonephila clavipes]
MGRTLARFKQHRVTTTRPMTCYAVSTRLRRSRHFFSFSPIRTWTAVREPGVCESGVREPGVRNGFLRNLGVPQVNGLYGVRSCILAQIGLAIHQNDHQARRRFVEWAQNEIAVVHDFHNRILFSDEAHFWLNGYVNKQNCRIWNKANPQVYDKKPLNPEKLTVWCT